LQIFLLKVHEHSLRKESFTHLILIGLVVQHYIQTESTLYLLHILVYNIKARDIHINGGV